MELSGVPTWATLGGLRLGKITVPTGVRELHIFADDDPAGRLAAELAAGRYTRDGLSVRLRWPAEGFADWNDFHRSRSAWVAA
jgi:DNA primase